MCVSKDRNWVYTMADQLVCEVMDQMAHISVQRQTERTTPDVAMDSVYGYINVYDQMEIRFRAEPSVFRRLTDGILGGNSENEEDIQETALEFFNVLCGRFVSELSAITHVPARFFSPQYKLASSGSPRESNEPLITLFFVTDKKELAEFSWSERAMDQLLKRSGM
jgi:chemotaxis protein CheY-P-specific phosphatase CheC